MNALEFFTFEAMNSTDKASFVLGTELSEEHFESLLALVTKTSKDSKCLRTQNALHSNIPKIPSWRLRTGLVSSCIIAI